MFMNLKIKNKLLIIVLATIIIISSIIASKSIFAINYLTEKNIQNYKKSSYTEKEEELKNYVSIVYKVIETYYEKSKQEISDHNLENIKKELLEEISHIKYSKDGYYWINNTDGIMLMHPYKTNLIGKSLLNKTDAKGKYYFKEMIKKSLDNDKGGLVKYSWQNANESLNREKFSYVKRFKEWNWIIGTGAYVDNIEKRVNIMKQHAQEEIEDIIWQIILISLIAGILISLLIIYISKKTIIQPIEEFQKGLLGFFAYLNKEKNDVEEINIHTKDEIGMMSINVNKNIQKTKMLLEDEKVLISKTLVLLKELELGNLSERIEVKTSNSSLNELTNLLNKMADNFEFNIDSVLKVLDEYTNYNYLNKIDTKNTKAHLKQLGSGLNSLGDSINEMLKHNKRIGLTLNSSSDTLLSNVEILNISSNSAAVSLEETAAALEEITSTITNNNLSITQMSTYASSLTQSTKNGQNLANKTMKSMDEINEQVISINTAITVIDQIAFQTNILSLNAAVEAATAGEAGKGFAVVAQEVRNLANRSAEAAKEIKELVNSANIKAAEGKTISQSMINGFSELNENISKTLNLMDDISNSSKEQQSGIEQINIAVSEQDQQTQKIAQAAGETYNIAIDTSGISKKIVDSVNEKQFIGKDDIQDRRKRNLSLNYQGNERRSSESSIRNRSSSNVERKNDINLDYKKTERRVMEKAMKEPIIVLPPVNNEEKWESF